MSVRNTILGGESYLDGATTALSSNISDVSTSIVVANGAVLKAAGFIKIDNEVIQYASKTTNTLNSCTRAIIGTTASAHVASSLVTQVEPGFSADFNDTFTAMNNSATNAYMYSLPIGSIISFHSSFAGAGTLPINYLECNGQTISDSQSPMNGVTLPNLNGTTDDNKMFLRGSATSGGIGGSSTHGQTASRLFSSSGSGSSNPSENLYAASHIPPFFEIRWVIRIK
jgi:hypothetical protein